MPGKAAYLALELDPEQEFECFLAQKLGRTVKELRRDLEHWEWLLWTRYYMRIQQAQELAAAKG